jgi:type IV pilus assembly protein PilV
MIEMLVGVLIISFGLLGLMALQSRALQVSVGSEDAQRAALLANEIASTMVNQNTVTLDDAVVQGWAARVADAASGGLSNGVGTVTVSGTTARVQIQWTPPQTSSGDKNGVHNYTTDVVIP